MKVAVDTNVLVHAVVGDDPVEARIAAKVLTEAELIAVALPCLCEFVWVLLRVYNFQSTDAAAAIRAQGPGQRQLQPGNQLAEHQPRSNASDDSNHPVDARGLIGVA